MAAAKVLHFAGPNPVLMSDFERALSAGGPACVEFLRDLGEKQRRSLAPEAIQWYRRFGRTDWNSPVDGYPYRVLQVTAPLMMMGTASFSELKKLRCHPIEDGLVLEVLGDRRPKWLTPWSVWFLEELPWRWPLVRSLVRAGVMEKPDSPAYILGMVAGPHGSSPLQTLKADPELLEEVPRLFEIEGNSQVSLAARDKYSTKDHGWAHALFELCEDGTLDRRELLFWSLQALGRGFPSFRAGWYSRFYESLKPTPQELGEHRELLLPLLASEVSSTVSFGMRWLKRALKSHPIEDEALLRGLEPVWGSAKKGVVRSAFSLLRQTEPGRQWLEPLSQVLLHPAAELQREAFGALRAVYPQPDGELKARLLGLGSALPPSLVGDWAEWLGEEQEQEQVESAAPGEQDVVQAVDPLTCHEQVCELAAQMIEELSSAIDLERLLDGLLRFRQLESPFYSSLRKRCRTRLREWDLRGPLAAVILRWTGEAVEWQQNWRREDKLEGFLVERLAELHRTLDDDSPRRLLALPTRSNGELEVETLLDRLQLSQATLEWDFAQALLRLKPGATSFQPTTTEQRLVAYALGGGEPKKAAKLWLKAAQEYRCAGPGEDWGLEVEVKQFESYGQIYTHRYVNSTKPLPSDPLLKWEVCAELPGSRRWQATICPIRRQRWYFTGTLRLAANLDWWGAEWADQVFLETLFEPESDWGRWGRVVAALGLGCKESTQRSLAVDAVGEALLAGRLEGEQLGEAMRECAATGVVKANRWEKSFSELRSFAPGGPLFEALAVLYDSPHPDFKGNPLLNSFYEIGCALGQPVTRAGCRGWLESFKGKSKAAKLATRLLALGEI